jgi:hypothetical protein
MNANPTGRVVVKMLGNDQLEPLVQVSELGEKHGDHIPGVLLLPTCTLYTRRFI